MGRFVLSDSQNSLLMEGVSQSFSGRVRLLNLFPFTTEELAHTVYRNVDPFDYIYRGMYPAAYDRRIAPTDLFPGYVHSLDEVDRTIEDGIRLLHWRRFVEPLWSCCGATSFRRRHSHLPCHGRSLCSKE
jgi:uncharacterized protein